jgi:hypothetical protein
VSKEEGEEDDEEEERQAVSEGFEALRGWGRAEGRAA